MLSIEKSALPADALLAEYVKDGCYTDCYSTEIRGAVTHAEYVVAFYTTFLFKTERLILKLLVGKPSTDQQAEQLASGDTDTFAAWYVEKRADNQILMCDFRDRTRSWLMISPRTDGEHNRSRLYFGSAVVPVNDPETGTCSLGLSFKLLAGFHRAYSVALLYFAKSRLVSQR